MPRVIFTENLQRHVHLPPRDVKGNTVREALDNLFEGNSISRNYILDERGALRKHMNIFVSGRVIKDRDGLGDPVAEDAEIHVIQALSGG